MKWLVDWFDERAGIRALAAGALDEPVPGGARWAYVFGSCLVFLLILQAVTGIVLASFYAPSVTDAWASVAYLNDQLPFGWFVRGLHSAGASAMVAVSIVHLLQVALWGAYKRPRELNWIVGVLLLGLVLAFALTGYLLPWDQKGYWATQVATSLVGAVPLVGHALQTALQGGDAYGNLTLTHFYALHTLILPLFVLTFVGAHLWLFRRHGITPSWSASPEQLERRMERFWPHQLGRDLVAIAVLFAGLALWVARTHGASLEAPADPTAAYDARPEWYNLPLFQLLKLFPGRSEVVAALGAPALYFGLLLALPLLDRGPSRAPRKRAPWVGLVLALVGLAALGGVRATREDLADPAYRAQREAAAREAERARTLARQGVPAEGGTAVFDNDPLEQGRKLFAVRCAGCHLLDGAGEARAPDLDGWGGRAYLAAVLRDPNGPHLFGPTKIRGMKPAPGTDEELRALVEYVYALGGGATSAVDESLRARGEALFKDDDCDECHEVDGASSGQGPNLGARATPESMQAFLRDPSEPRFFGRKNEMPRFGEKLSPSEIESLARLVLSQRDAAPAR